MIAAGSTRAVVTPLTEDDEQSLLLRLEGLLDREERMLAAGDASGLAAIAEERDQVAARLGAAARARRLSSSAHGDEADLVTLYTRLRQRHEVRAKVLQRYEKRNATAISVIAQATGQASLYDADGRVPMHFAAA